MTCSTCGELAMIKTSSVENYLRALSAACREAADEPRARPLLFALLALAPRTIAELRWEGARARNRDAHVTLESRSGGKCVGTFPYRLAALIMSNRAFS